MNQFKDHDATLHKPQPKHIKEAIDEMWIVFKFDLGNADILEHFKIFNIILECWNIPVADLECWQEKGNMPLLSNYLDQSFEYYSEEYYNEECSQNCMLEEINNTYDEKRWKQLVKNYFAWHGYYQEKGAIALKEMIL